MKTVKVEMLTSIGGLPEPRYGLGDFAFGPGQVVEIHPELARHWIAGGLCKAVDAPDVAPIPETASLAPEEKAVLPDAKPKKAVKEFKNKQE